MAKDSKRWYSMKAAKGGTAAQIRIFNDIGDFGVTADAFAHEIESLGEVKTMDIAISSNGGDVSQGFAIFNILARHKAWKRVTVEGLAASMASVIAMVGDEVVMPSNSMMMIHNPWGALMGEADQIVSFGEALAMMQDNIADAYVARANVSKDEVLQMMARETWLSAKKAVELGFADSVENPMQIAAGFDLRKFNHVPKKFADANKRIATMSKQRAAAPETDDSEEGKADTTKTAAEIRKDVLAHGREVRSLCNLAGFPKMADKLIDDDKTISEVIVALDAAKAKAATGGKGGKSEGGNADELDNHNNGRGDNDRSTATVDPRDIYSRWNSAGKNVGKK